MKAKKSFYFCEYCDAQIEDASPPTEIQYREGVIKLGEYSSILLNNAGVPGGGHAEIIGGMYCNITCLCSHLKTIRNRVEIE